MKYSILGLQKTENLIFIPLEFKLLNKGCRFSFEGGDEALQLFNQKNEKRMIFLFGLYFDFQGFFPSQENFNPFLRPQDRT